MPRDQGCWVSVSELYLPPPAALSLVLIGKDGSCAWLTADGHIPTRVQLVHWHILVHTEANSDVLLTIALLGHRSSFLGAGHEAFLSYFAFACITQGLQCGDCTMRLLDNNTPCLQAESRQALQNCTWFAMRKLRHSEVCIVSTLRH